VFSWVETNLRYGFEVRLFSGSVHSQSHGFCGEVVGSGGDEDD